MQIASCLAHKNYTGRQVKASSCENNQYSHYYWYYVDKICNKSI